ncbi:MAG: M20 family metallopeptidase [Oscillospiraceae bacterium]|nr:M20 family metallopeptidase [Oscillospiraceae bacterium]
MSRFRRDLHQAPEVSAKEYNTAEYISQQLQAMGIPAQRMCDTAVVGRLTFSRPGPVIAIRADMDALKITEDTGCEFSSQVPGVMHACGHDFHMSAALGAALLLSQNRDACCGEVRFLFQPNEEDDGGAERMIAAGCLENPSVDAVFGMHVCPDLPAGILGVRYGKFYAASNTYRVVVHGKSCHAAQPENGIDALLAAAEMITSLDQLKTQLQAKYGRLVITTGMLQAGTLSNIVADTAVFEGIIRTLGPEARAATVNSFNEAIRRISDAHGTTVEIIPRDSYPGIVNHDAISAYAEQTIRNAFGSEKLQVLSEPVMTTEDFGYFLQERPGTFIHFGVGGSWPLHNPHFLPDSSLLPYAAAMYAELVTNYCSR